MEGFKQMIASELKFVEKRILDDIISKCNNKEAAEYKITISWLNQQIVDWVDSENVLPFNRYLYNKLNEYGLVSQNVSFDYDIDVKSVRLYLKKTRFGYYL
jgi:hypothetical protein